MKNRFQHKGTKTQRKNRKEARGFSGIDRRLQFSRPADRLELMAFKRWRGLIGAAVGATLLLGVQVSMSAILAFEVKGIPALVPDVRIRVLFDIFVFVAGLMACYRPGIPSKACSFQSSCVRSLLWAVLLAGFWFEAGSLLRLSLLPISLVSMAKGSLGLMVFIWIAAFGLFASDARECRRNLSLPNS